MFLTVYNSHTRVKCKYCFKQIEDTSADCQNCGGKNYSAYAFSIVNRLISSFRTEISADLVVLKFDKPEQLFSNDDIDRLLKLEELSLLELEDVPNWDLMFLNSEMIKFNKSDRQVLINRFIFEIVDKEDV